MHPETVMQSEKQISCINSYVKSRKTKNRMNKLINTKDRLVVDRSDGWKVSKRYEKKFPVYNLQLVVGI